MNAPAPIADWLASLPSQNCGKFFATIKSPGWFGLFQTSREYQVPIWGQVCDGQARRAGVHTALLYNTFPNHGKGYTYVSWRTEPDNPEQCKYPTSGNVENPKPYSGVPHSDE